MQKRSLLATFFARGLFCLKQIRMNRCFVLMMAGTFTGKSQCFHIGEEISSFIQRILPKSISNIEIYQFKCSFTNDFYFFRQKVNYLFSSCGFEIFICRQLRKIVCCSFILQTLYEFNCLHNFHPFYIHLVNLLCLIIVNTSISPFIESVTKRFTLLL